MVGWGGLRCVWVGACLKDPRRNSSELDVLLLFSSLAFCSLPLLRLRASESCPGARTLRTLLSCGGHGPPSQSSAEGLAGGQTDGR